VSFIAGCLLGGYFAAWLGLRRAMLYLIIGLNAQSAVFLFLSSAQPTSLAVISGAVCLENLTWGFGSTAVMLFLFQTVAAGKYQTAHYAVGSGFMGLGFSMFKIVSGDMQLALGYRNFFVLSLLCAIPAIVMSRFLHLRGNEEAAQEAAVV
jgi:PAT family beta-lactamase induction signal transducer AmpG